MTNDPILMALKIAFLRIALYCVSSVLATISLWTWALVVCLDRPLSDFWAYTAAAFRPGSNPEVALLGGLCGAVGCLIIAFVFQLAVVWWRRPRVLHVRGTRLIDTRRGKGR